MKTGSSLPRPQQRDISPYQVQSISHLNYFLSHGMAAILGLEVLYDFSRSHSDTLQSVGLLWMSDQPVAETSN